MWHIGTELNFIPPLDPCLIEVPSIKGTKKTNKKNKWIITMRTKLFILFEVLDLRKTDICR